MIELRITKAIFGWKGVVTRDSQTFLQGDRGGGGRDNLDTLCIHPWNVMIINVMSKKKSILVYNYVKILSCDVATNKYSVSANNLCNCRHYSSVLLHI